MNSKTMATIFCLVLMAIQVPFIVQDPSRWWNWVEAVLCFGVGIARATRS